MASTEDRIRKIIADNIDDEREVNFDATLADSGASSVECITFYKVVNNEFGLGLAANECLQFKTLRDLVTFIDARG